MTVTYHVPLRAERWSFNLCAQSAVILVDGIPLSRFFLWMNQGDLRESGGSPRILLWMQVQDAPLVSNQLVDSRLLLDQSLPVLFWINQYTFFDVHL